LVFAQRVDPPLSPELVLVSPDLKVRALVEERTAPPLYVVPPLDEVVPLQPDVAPPQPDVAPPQPDVAPPQPPAPIQISAPAPPREWRLTVGGATLIALAAIVVFGGGVAVGQFALPTPATRSAASTVIPNTAQATTPTGEREATPVPVRQPEPAAQPTRARVATAKAVRPIPDGGYVLPDQRGRFRLSSNGRTILGLTLDTRCAGLLTLPPIDVGTTGAFAFAGHPAASPRGTTVRVKGRFVSPTEARGTTEVVRATCREPSNAFAAQLS
jgi:hypothetical protein